MDTIVFSGLPTHYVAAMYRVFELIKSGKEDREINESLVRDALGERVNQFIRDPKLIQELTEKWRKDKNTPLPWDFGSWIDALTACEVVFHSLQIERTGSGEIRFERLAWPCGGIEATEEIVKVFGGHIVSNSAR